MTPASLTSLMDSAAFVDDPTWFDENQDRSHRLRLPFPDEIGPADELASLPYVYAVLRQIEPGSIALYYFLPDDPLPMHLSSDEHFAHALFDACEADLKGQDMPSLPEILQGAAQLRAHFRRKQ